MDLPPIIVSMASALLSIAVGFVVNRSAQARDKQDKRIHALELKLAAHYSDRDAVDAAIARVVEPLRAAIVTQSGQIEETNRLILKLVHRRGDHA